MPPPQPPWSQGRAPTPPMPLPPLKPCPRLTMASSTSISLTGGAQAANIFWQVAGTRPLVDILWLRLSQFTPARDFATFLVWLWSSQFCSSCLTLPLLIRSRFFFRPEQGAHYQSELSHHILFSLHFPRFIFLLNSISFSPHLNWLRFYFVEFCNSTVFRRVFALLHLTLQRHHMTDDHFCLLSSPPSAVEFPIQKGFGLFQNTAVPPFNTSNWIYYDFFVCLSFGDFFPFPVSNLAQ